MQQSNLLELAKQGEPTAIAALMNAVLEPTGILAQARWETDCLWIALESPKPLNPETLITFIRRGLLDLGNESIRSVKVQGKKRGEVFFAWTRELELYPNPSSTSREAISAESVGEIEQILPSMGAVALKEKPEPILEEPDLELTSPRSIEINPTVDAPDLEITSLSSLEKLLEIHEVESELTPEIIEIERDTIATSQAVVARSSPETLATIEPIAFRETDTTAWSDPILETETVQEWEVEETSEQEEESEEATEADLDTAPTLRAWLKTYWQIYSLPVLIVVITGFVVGSAVAFWSTSQLQGNSVLPQEDTVENKQKEAEAYIKAMNSAQEAFYQKNNRFATSLEELERSANLISQSYSYAYQLRVSDRSLITALPRETGLKSYIGAVFVAPTGTKSVVCQAIKSSMQAPMAPQFSKKKLAACAPRSLKVQ